MLPIFYEQGTCQAHLHTFLNYGVWFFVFVKQLFYLTYLKLSLLNNFCIGIVPVALQCLHSVWLLCQAHVARTAAPCASCSAPFALAAPDFLLLRCWSAAS